MAGADTETKELLLLLPTRCASHPVTAQRESSGTRQPCVSLRLHWRSTVALPNTHKQRVRRKLWSKCAEQERLCYNSTSFSFLQLVVLALLLMLATFRRVVLDPIYMSAKLHCRVHVALEPYKVA